MEKAKGKRKKGDEDEGVHKQSRLGLDEEMSSPEVTVSPPMREDGSFGRYVYEIGENLTKRYQIRSKLGEGSSGEVLECWDREKQESVAIKVSRSTRQPGVVMYERYILQKLAELPGSIPRFVQMRDSFVYRKHECILLTILVGEDRDDVCVRSLDTNPTNETEPGQAMKDVFEKLGPSLRKFLQMRNCSPVPLDLVWQFGRRLLEAVAFLHDANVIHADLKPENILLASRYYAELLPRERSSSDEVQSYWPQSSAIKVIDFGSSSSLEPNQIQAKHHTGFVTTRSYRAPEIVLGLEWTYPADLWSVGCILAELCTGQVLFQVDQELDLEHLISMERVLGCPPKDMLQRASPKDDFGTVWTLNWPEGASSEDSISRVNNHRPLQELVSRHVQSSELINLLYGLLKYEPSERLTAQQAMDHPFFTKDIRWDIDQEGNLTITHPRGK